MNPADLRALLATSTTGPWTTEAGEFSGKNWMVASLGNGEDGLDHFVTTQRVHASEYFGDAQADAALIVALRNEADGLLDRLEAAEGAVAGEGTALMEYQARAEAAEAEVARLLDRQRQQMAQAQELADGMRDRIAAMNDKRYRMREAYLRGWRKLGAQVKEVGARLAEVKTERDAALARVAELERDVQTWRLCAMNNSDCPRHDFTAGEAAGIERALAAVEDTEVVEATRNTMYAQLGDARGTLKAAVAAIRALLPRKETP